MLACAELGPRPGLSSLKAPGTLRPDQKQRLSKVKKTHCDLSLGNSQVGPERSSDPEGRSHIAEVSASTTAFSSPSGLVWGESLHTGV